MTLGFSAKILSDPKTWSDTDFRLPSFQVLGWMFQYVFRLIPGLSTTLNTMELVPRLCEVRIVQGQRNDKIQPKVSVSNCSDSDASDIAVTPILRPDSESS